MNVFMNVLQGQLDKVKQANKHYTTTKGEKAKKSSSVILATNIVRLEKIVQEALKVLSEAGVDVEKCRKDMSLNKR